MTTAILQNEALRLKGMSPLDPEQFYEIIQIHGSGLGFKLKGISCEENFWFHSQFFEVVDLYPNITKRIADYSKEYEVKERPDKQSFFTTDGEF